MRILTMCCCSFVLLPLLCVSIANAAAYHALGNATRNATAHLQALIHQPDIQAQALEWGVPELEALALMAATKRVRDFDTAPPESPLAVGLGDGWKVASLPDQSTLFLLADVKEAPETAIWLAVQRRGTAFFSASSRSDNATGWIEIPAARSAYDVWQLGEGLALELEILPVRGATVRHRFRSVMQ